MQNAWWLGVSGSDYGSHNERNFGIKNILEPAIGSTNSDLGLYFASMGIPAV